MLKAEKEVVSSYKAMEAKLQAGENNLADLQGKLAVANNKRSQAEGKYDERKLASESTNLIIIEDIEAQQAKLNSAQSHVNNSNQLVENLEFAIENSETSTKKLRDKQKRMRTAIFCELLPGLAQEIKTVAEDLFNRYAAAYLNAHQGEAIDPHFVTENLKFIAGRECNTRELADEMLAEVLK